MGQGADKVRIGLVSGEGYGRGRREESRQSAEWHMARKTNYIHDVIKPTVFAENEAWC